MKASFISPMLLLKTEKLPADRAVWEYQIKLDGYRSIAFRSGGILRLRSRNDKDFSRAYPEIVTGLSGLPDETAIDGEVVALDESGRPSFSALQTHAPGAPLLFYVFDLMVLEGVNVMREALSRRRELLEQRILPKLAEPVRYASVLDADLGDLVESVKAHGLEGLVAKRRDSPYEPGLRSGAWRKMRVNRAHDFVIGGYTVGGHPFDAIVLGYYEGKDLVYTARTRNGFTPASRAALFRRFSGLEISKCPFVNLPETRSGRWGQGLTSAKMLECRWLKPLLVGTFEFLEWTGENHLRHVRFVALREDVDPSEVVREGE